MTFQRVATWYSRFAVLFLNTVIFLAVLLVVLQVVLDANRVPIVSRSKTVYSKAFNLASYKLISQEEAVQTGQDFDQMGEQESYAFNPWTTFQERPFEGKLVSVKHEFTSSVRGTKAPIPAKEGQKELIVWTFGGSTMFGWGVPDSQTIASHLQDQLQAQLPSYRIQVINHGHSYYFSSMEVALYMALLRTDKKPDIVVFMDGLNDCVWSAMGMTAPQFSGAAVLAWETERQRRFTGDPKWITVSPAFPPLRAMQALRANSGSGRLLLQENNPYIRGVSNFGDEILRVYRLNRDMAASISAKLGIDVYFFLQPVSWYKAESAKQVPGGNEAYESLIAEANAKTFPRFYTLHDVLAKQELPFVDGAHYSDRGSQIIAEHMAQIVAPNWQK